MVVIMELDMVVVVVVEAAVVRVMVVV